MFPSTPRPANQENCVQMNNKAALAHGAHCTPSDGRDDQDREQQQQEA